MKSMLLRLFAVLLAMGMARAEVLQDTVPDWLKVEGFGTLGAMHADDPNVTVRADARTSTGARDETVYDADSLLALQLKIKPHGPFSAGFQFISKKDIHSSDRPRVQWAYLGWEPTSEFNLKLGRSVAPVFLMSDYVDLYYSQITARPVQTVYLSNAITYNDGITGQWERNLGESVVSVEGYYGNSGVDLSVGKIKVNRQFGLSGKWVSGPWTLRAAYTQATGGLYPTAGNSVDQFINLVRNAQQLGICSNCDEKYRDRFESTSVVNHMPTFGIVWDNDDYMLQWEWTRRTTGSSILAGSKGWYVLGAKHMGQLTPYGFVGKAGPASDDVGLGVVVPPGATPTQIALAGVLSQANAANITGRYVRDQYGLGLRWDFHKQAALKLQWDLYKLNDPTWGSVGPLDYAQGPGTKFDGRVNTYTVNVDFIF